MQAHKFSVVMAAIVAVTAFASAPAMAQTTTAQPTTAQKQSSRVADRSPARLTVRKRSYLEPGTETKRHAEHYMDYAHPPGGSSPFMNPTLFYSGPGLPVMFDRMPFPNCFDLAGYCR